MVYIGMRDDKQGLIDNLPELKSMMLLADKGPLSVGQIANYIGSTPTAMTATLNRLEEKELVKRARDPQDRRMVVCDLTSTGRIVLEGVKQDVRVRVLATTDTWSMEQFESVVEALESIHPSEE